MNKSERIEYVYRTQIPIREVAEKYAVVSKSNRLKSPIKDKANQDLAIYLDTQTFCDFALGQFGGDAVILDYYLSSGGKQLAFEKGIDSAYFQHKARMLKVDLEMPDIEFKKTFIPPKPKPQVPQVQEAEIQSREELNLNFRILANYLYFTKGKEGIRKHLLDRGMTNEEINKSPFLIAPKPADSNKIVNEIINKGTDVIGVPGFYKSKNGYVLKTSGIDAVDNLMIPVINIDKQIVSFHMRGLQPGSIYWSLSSAGEEMGCSPGAPTGFWGEIKPGDRVILTEGALKGYLAHIWTGMPVIYILGVSSQSFLSETLEKARKKGASKVILAFDMDYTTNESVKNASSKALKKIVDSGLDSSLALWPKEYNGIDDFIVEARKRGKLKEFIHYLNTI